MVLPAKFYEEKKHLPGKIAEYQCQGFTSGRTAELGVYAYVYNNLQAFWKNLYNFCTGKERSWREMW